MNRFAVLAQVFHRESFWHSCLLRPFRPCVTVAVQRDAFDFEADAPLMEFRGAVASANRAEIGEQRAVRWQRAQYLAGFLVKAQDGDGAGFLPCEADDSVLPINVLGFQIRK